MRNSNSIIGLFFFLSCLSLLSCTDSRKGSRENNNTNKNESIALIDTLSRLSALPKIAKSPNDNPTTPEKVALGKLLFFDPILSGNKDVACATCHHPSNGFAESLDLSIGVNGIGFGGKRIFNQPNNIPLVKRNSPTVLNTAFNGIDIYDNYNPARAPMFWDNRVESLEKQSLEPIKAFEEMRGHAYSQENALKVVVGRLKKIAAYQSMFAAAFKEDNPINITNLGKAIAAYERTLITPNSRFDQFMRGDQSAISESEKEGLDEFIKAGCAKCHNGPMFSDFKTHVLGVPENVKLPKIDSGFNNTFAFRTPTLRNLRFTFPYMHNGSLKSLKEILEFYEDLSNNKSGNSAVPEISLDELGTSVTVDVKNMNQIISFLNSLNDEGFDNSVPQSVPSGLPVGGNIN